MFSNSRVARQGSTDTLEPIYTKDLWAPIKRNGEFSILENISSPHLGSHQANYEL